MRPTRGSPAASMNAPIGTSARRRPDPARVGGAPDRLAGRLLRPRPLRPNRQYGLRNRCIQDHGQPPVPRPRQLTGTLVDRVGRAILIPALPVHVETCRHRADSFDKPVFISEPCLSPIRSRRTRQVGASSRSSKQRRGRTRSRSCTETGERAPALVVFSRGLRRYSEEQYA